MSTTEGTNAKLFVIEDDIGGTIRHYIEYYDAVRESGGLVAIKGNCLSACTLLLGILPREQVCVTDNAVLGFHAAWKEVYGEVVRDNAGTQVLWSLYPKKIRDWISKHGGLKQRMIYLYGSTLSRMYRQCPASLDVYLYENPQRKPSR